MSLKFISDDAYNHLLRKLEEILDYVAASKRKNPLDDTWLDNQEVCSILKISKRTLQTYRDTGMLPYSKINGKVYFKAADIQNHLLSNYNK